MEFARIFNRLTSCMGHPVIGYSVEIFSIKINLGLTLCLDIKEK